MNWLYLAGWAIVLFTSLNLLQKVLATDAKNMRAMSFVFNFYAGTVAIGIAAITGKLQNISLNVSTLGWILLLVSCLFYASFERLRFIVADLLDASVYSIVSTIAVAVAFFSSAFIYNEPLTPAKLLGFALVTTSLIIVSNGNKGVKISKKGLLLSIFSFVMLGFGWALDKIGTTNFNADTYNVFVWTIPVVLIYLPSLPVSDIKAEMKAGSWKLLLLALLNVSGYLLQLKALELAEATKVIPIIQTSIVTTVIAGIIFLKEKDMITKKVVAGLIAMGGVFLLI